MSDPCLTRVVNCVGPYDELCPPLYKSTQTYTAVCQEGFSGRNVSATASAESGVSQADADEHALAEAQAVAEAQLVCVEEPATWGLWYTPADTSIHLFDTRVNEWDPFFPFSPDPATKTFARQAGNFVDFDGSLFTGASTVDGVNIYKITTEGVATVSDNPVRGSLSIMGIWRGPDGYLKVLTGQVNWGASENIDYMLHSCEDDGTVRQEVHLDDLNTYYQNNNAYATVFAPNINNFRVDKFNHGWFGFRSGNFDEFSRLWTVDTTEGDTFGDTLSYFELAVVFNLRYIVSMFLTADHLTVGVSGGYRVFSLADYSEVFAGFTSNGWATVLHPSKPVTWGGQYTGTIFDQHNYSTLAESSTNTASHTGGAFIDAAGNRLYSCGLTATMFEWDVSGTNFSLVSSNSDVSQLQYQQPLMNNWEYAYGTLAAA